MLTELAPKSVVAPPVVPANAGIQVIGLRDEF
jgi:hypothetical protein